MARGHRHISGHFHCPLCSVQGKPNKQKTTGHSYHLNFLGKSGAMEVEDAVHWSQSIDLNFRYETFVSDVDPNTYKSVCQLNDGRRLYDVPVTKEEYLNHVSQKKGIRLREIKDARENITIWTGKQKRRRLLGGTDILTNNVIDHLSLVLYEGHL